MEKTSGAKVHGDSVSGNPKTHPSCRVSVKTNPLKHGISKHENKRIKPIEVLDTLHLNLEGI